MQKYFETERLILRVLDRSFSQPVLNYYDRNRQFLQKWEPIKDDKFYTPEFHANMLDNDLFEMESGRLLRVWLTKKDNCPSDRIIGSVAFNNIVRGAFWSCFLGYKLDKDEINKGYITEAIRKGIDIIFNDYKLHRIEANIMPSNLPSLRVAEKLGFYNEGLAHKYLNINGRWEDHIHMVLLNDRV